MDDSGKTALMLAASNHSLECVSLLLDHGVDVTVRSEGMTAKSLALKPPNKPIHFKIAELIEKVENKTGLLSCITMNYCSKMNSQ